MTVADGSNWIRRDRRFCNRELGSLAAVEGSELDAEREEEDGLSDMRYGLLACSSCGS